MPLIKIVIKHIKIDIPGSNTFYTIVCINNNEIIGTCNVSIKGQNIWVHRLGVVSEFRGQGIGKSIIEYIEKIFKNQRIFTNNYTLKLIKVIQQLFSFILI